MSTTEMQAGLALLKLPGMLVLTKQKVARMEAPIKNLSIRVLKIEPKMKPRFKKKVVRPFIFY